MENAFPHCPRHPQAYLQTVIDHERGCNVAHCSECGEVIHEVWPHERDFRTKTIQLR